MAKAKEINFLSAADILGADDIEYRNLSVPEWEGDVRLRLLTAQQSVQFQGQLQANRKEASLALVRHSMVDEDGNQVFNLAADFKALQQKSMKVIRRIADECLDLNGLMDPSREAKLAARMLREQADNYSTEVADALHEIADELDVQSKEADIKN